MCRTSKSFNTYRTYPHRLTLIKANKFSTMLRKSNDGLRYGEFLKIKRVRRIVSRRSVTRIKFQKNIFLLENLSGYLDSLLNSLTWALIFRQSVWASGQPLWMLNSHANFLDYLSSLTR